jgi:photosystem II stability/assembly factor-like uncharacterized protein
MDIQKNCQDKEFPAGGSHFYSRATPRIISVDPPFVDDLSVRFYLLYETKSLIDTFNATDTGDIRMATYLYLATAIGLFVVTQTDGNLTVVGHTLKEQPLTSVAVSRGVILAGTTQGIWRSTDNGQTWNKANENLTIQYVRWITAASETSQIILAGTEPAGIFVSRDGANTWRSAPEVGELRDSKGWCLPYSSEAGCVRGFAIAGAASNQVPRMYAAVEVGGVLVSDNGGITWQLVDGSDGKPDMNRDLGSMIHPDVHSITVHPASSDLVTAATGGGLYRSIDGGRSWKILYRCYIRAAWVDPADPGHIIAGPADGVSRNGRIEESRDGGQTWHPAATGMQAPWRRYMVERFFQKEETLFAVLSNGQLWSKQLDGPAWQRILPEVPHVKAIAAGG